MVKYLEDLPDTCPPADAENVDRELFKAIDGNRPREKDFKSFAERKRPGIDPEECDSWGLSVWPDMVAVRHALRVYPTFRRKSIIRFTVTKQDGCLKFTPSKKQPDHHTFWKDCNRSLLHVCEIVLKPREEA
jgi:hypothetical protein